MERWEKEFEKYWNDEGSLGLSAKDKGGLVCDAARVAFHRAWFLYEDLVSDQVPFASLVARSSTPTLLEILASRGGATGALGEAGLLFERKGQDYNTGFKRDDYFPMGLASYAQMLWVKCLRMLSFAKTPRQENYEGMRDTCLDLINYAAFCADWLKRSKENGDGPKA